MKMPRRTRRNQRSAKVMQRDVDVRLAAAQTFERAYADRSGLSLDELHRLGLYAKPCACATVECTGWAIDWENRGRRAQP